MSVEIFDSTVALERYKSPENILPEVDELSLRTSQGLHSLDLFIDRGIPLMTGEPVIERYQNLTNTLEEKSEEDLLSFIDPTNTLKPEIFSYFQISVHPPGAIHIELGTPGDLEAFRKFLSRGGLHEIFQGTGMDDTREADHFAAQYFALPSEVETNYLGVIVTIRDQIKSQEENTKAIRHEYSHAVLQQVIRPECHNQVVPVDLFHSPASSIKKALDTMERSDLLQLATHLDVVPPPFIKDHMFSLWIGARLKEEQFLLDELRAFSYNFPPLPPKFQTTYLDLTDDDNPASAQIQTVKKYFEVWLLHLRARIFSPDAKASSLSLLGASLSLGQAHRLLEQSALTWKFNEQEDNKDFTNRFRVLCDIVESDQYMDFNHTQGGQLVSPQRAREVLIPTQSLVDEEVKRRFGSIDQAPEQFREDYRTLYA